MSCDMPFTLSIVVPVFHQRRARDSAWVSATAALVRVGNREQPFPVDDLPAPRATAVAALFDAVERGLDPEQGHAVSLAEAVEQSGGAARRGRVFRIQLALDQQIILGRQGVPAALHQRMMALLESVTERL